MEVKHSIIPQVNISPSEFHEKVFGSIVSGIYLGQISFQDIIDHKPTHCILKKIDSFDVPYMYLATIEVPNKFIDKYNTLKEKYGSDIYLYPVYCSANQIAGVGDLNKYWICCWVMNGPDAEAILEGGDSNE